MRNFKKIIINMASILAILVLISAIIINPYLSSEFEYFQDADVRKNMAGSIDFLIVGTSNAMEAYNPAVIDQRLGVNSYNLSSVLMPLDSRIFLLEKELNRNQVEIVIIDVPYDTLTRNSKNEFANGDGTVFGRLDSWGERFQFISRCVEFNDLLNLYARQLLHGMEYWMSRILYGEISNVDHSSKGFRKMMSNDVSITAMEAKEKKDTGLIDMNFLKDNVASLEDMINLCHSRNIRVILTVPPMPDSAVWTHYNQDEYDKWMRQFSQEKDCEFYDFNLLKNRFELFDDTKSFFDAEHMSSEGAERFTQMACVIIERAKKNSVSEYFYNSYEEMKQDSPYMKMLEN